MGIIVITGQTDHAFFLERILISCMCMLPARQCLFNVTGDAWNDYNCSVMCSLEILTRYENLKIQSLPPGVLSCFDFIVQTFFFFPNLDLSEVKISISFSTEKSNNGMKIRLHLGTLDQLYLDVVNVILWLSF